VAQIQHAFNSAGQRLSDWLLPAYRSGISQAQQLGNEIANALSSAANAVEHYAEEAWDEVSSWL